MGFKAKIHHPHKYLLQYLRSIKDLIDPPAFQRHPIAQTSWALLNDSYQDPRILAKFRLSEIAIACIHLSLQTYGVNNPILGDQLSWIKVSMHVLH